MDRPTVTIDCGDGYLITLMAPHEEIKKWELSLRTPEDLITSEEKEDENLYKLLVEVHLLMIQTPEGFDLIPRFNQYTNELCRKFATLWLQVNVD